MNVYNGIVIPYDRSSAASNQNEGITMFVRYD